jgi:SAM-dependent methyltransferase
MKQRYEDAEFRELLAAVGERRGWDFSSMRASVAPTPWEYSTVVRANLRPSDRVLDVGTGGGERLVELAADFSYGLGVDPDLDMIATAQANAERVPNLRFIQGDARLRTVSHSFDVILNRHAIFDLGAVIDHLRPGGTFITQQVGERNMSNVRAALGERPGNPTITMAEINAVPGLVIDRFEEYDVEYVVHDIVSLLFWFNALDLCHADLDGSSAGGSVDILNAVLSGNVDDRGFTTNEHRYLLVAHKTAD